MRIKSFWVKGYKNLVSPVALDGLDSRNVVVIHGSNNVGKSNLLEALLLPFLLLGHGASERAPLPFGTDDEFPSSDRLNGIPLEPSEIFTLGAPTPIEVRVSVTFTDDELRSRGLKQVQSFRDIEIGVQVDGYPDSVTWRVTRFRFGDGQDAAADAHIDESSSLVIHKFALHFSRQLIGRRFVLSNLHRQDADGSRAHGRGILTDQLILDLYDAKESNDPRDYLRWEAFERVCADFGDVLGGARPVVTYDRSKERATLFMQSAAGRLPAHLLGTGVQQLLAIVARILVSKADIVAVEEPEASVSVALHARVRDAMVRMTQVESGLTQLFLTSHSPWFDGTEDFVAITSSADGPVVQWRNAKDARLFTQQDIPPPPNGRAPLSYITPEGLVSLPPFVREHLGLEHGGGVVFSPAGAGRISMVSNETALKELGEADDVAG
jgi:hypothetical protein